MSEPQTEHRLQDSNTLPDAEVSLREAGITQNPNGSYMLPPVLVQYRDGVYQTLVIEVSNRERPATITTLWNLARTAQQPPRNEADETLDAPDSAVNNNQQPLSNETEINQSASANERQIASMFQNAATMTQVGGFRRGTDNSSILVPVPVPAPAPAPAPPSDIDRQAAERLLTSRLVDPLQRLFDRMAGQNNNRSNTIGAQQNAPTPVSRPHTPQTQQTSQNQGTASQSTTTPSNEIELRMPGDSRNIILTVNYIQGGQGNEHGSGSLLLYVPSIVETAEENVQLLVRLATEIALRTISTLLQKSAGVSEKVFEGLQVKKLNELKLSEQECSICYDSYVEKESISGSENKKKRDLESAEDEDREHVTKKRKSNTEEAIDINNEETEKSEKKGTRDPGHEHYPIALKCNHVFGASCLREWFKTNSTCPLCREKLPNLSETDNTPQDIQITLPNLASVIRRARPLIDNLSNREMTFHFREDDQETIDRILHEDDTTVLSPIANQALIETLTSLRALPDRRNLTGVPTGLPSISTPNTTEIRRPRPATSANSILNFVREVISSMRRDNTTAPGVNGTASNAFPGPMGVESRRTANGVETRDYTMFGEERRRESGDAGEPSNEQPERNAHAADANAEENSNPHTNTNS